MEMLRGGDAGPSSLGRKESELCSLPIGWHVETGVTENMVGIPLRSRPPSSARRVSNPANIIYDNSISEQKY